MARTKHTAQKSAGGKVPRKQIAHQANLKSIPSMIQRSRGQEGTQIQTGHRGAARNSPIPKMDGVVNSSSAIIAMQEAADAYLVRLCEDSNLAAIHAKRVTIQPKDMHSSRNFYPPNSNNNDRQTHSWL
ncbi:hypothetical protein CcCBS67573_g07801 [Chytriomyces confervae]|uniref:Core Histone H2A/H2B/H3 domain-containing protein n=1 Tax=Chytriomyces confervae TaxID=246404 RepID=A0A507ET68_9FUNG|nr:hypothetical protein CcCBS67573_g07801 [Chytriomyces confervae]